MKFKRMEPGKYHVMTDAGKFVGWISRKEPYGFGDWIGFLMEDEGAPLAGLHRTIREAAESLGAEQAKRDAKRKAKG